MNHKLPELNALCQKNELRPLLNFVYIDVEKGNVVATNAICIVIHKIKDLFKDIDITFDKSVLISSDGWKKLTEPFKKLELVGDCIMVHRGKGDSDAIKLTNLDGEYLPYETATFLDKSTPVEPKYFTIDSEELLKLTRAMSVDKRLVSFTTYPTKITLSFDHHTNETRSPYENSVKALIMRCRDSELR